MIDLKFLEKLIKAVDASGIDFIEIDRGGTRIRVGKTPPAAPVISGSSAPVSANAAAPGTSSPDTGGEAASQGAETPAGAPARSDLIEVKSPMVGTFYRSPSPTDAPYVEVGAKVSKGETLCIIEAMKLMNELEAEVEGAVAEICVENGQPVEYGQVLFRLEPV